MSTGFSGVSNDATHSLLSRTRPVAQRTLRQSGRAVARRVGAAQVLEVEAKTALTLCGVPSRPWSLNPYAGCSHACLYCYVPDVAHLERGRWGSYVVVKRNLANVLDRELRTKEPRPVFLSSATDPYQAVEATHHVTRDCLEVLLRRADWPLQVLTRSPLVMRDASLLRRFSQVEVGLSVPTLDDDVRRAVEPSAPPIEARMRALSRLADAGVTTYAHLMPAFPWTGRAGPMEVAVAFRDAGVGSVRAGPMRYLENVMPALRARLEGSVLASFERAVADPMYYPRMFKALSRAFERVGVAFNPGRAS